jgi:anti-anti-sigma factor
MTSRADEPARGDELAQLEVDELRVGLRTVLVASGEIERMTADALSEAIERAAISGALELWIDLTAVGFMDSTGLKLLLEARTAFSSEPRRFTVICPPGPVRRLLEIAGLDGVLAIYPDRSAAHAAG